MDDWLYCTGNAELRGVDLRAVTTDRIAIRLEGFHELVPIGARSWGKTSCDRTLTIIA